MLLLYKVFKARLCVIRQIGKGQKISEAIFLGLNSSKNHEKIVVISIQASKMGQIKKPARYKTYDKTNYYRSVDLKDFLVSSILPKNKRKNSTYLLWSMIP